MNPNRVGLIQCSARKAPARSHHAPTSAAERPTSSGSTVALFSSTLPILVAARARRERAVARKIEYAGVCPNRQHSWSRCWSLVPSRRFRQSFREEHESNCTEIRRHFGSRRHPHQECCPTRWTRGRCRKRGGGRRFGNG